MPWAPATTCWSPTPPWTGGRCARWPPTARPGSASRSWPTPKRTWTWWTAPWVTATSPWRRGGRRLTPRPAPSWPRRRTSTGRRTRGSSHRGHRPGAGWRGTAQKSMNVAFIDSRRNTGSGSRHRVEGPGLDDGEGGRGHRDRVLLDRDARAGRDEHASAGLPERQPDGAGAEVRHDPQPPPPDQEPARVLVEVGVHPVEPRIGQLGPGPAQRDQLPVPGVQAKVRLLVALLPVELGAAEGRLVLGGGHVGRVPAVRGELGLTPLGDGLGQPGVDVVGEVLPRSVRAPLLAHEQHRGVGRGQHQAGADLDQLGRERGGDPVAEGPVSDLVVILQVTEEAVSGHAEHVDLPPVRPAAEGGPDAVVEEHPGVGLGQRRQRPEVAVVALPFAGDRRVHRVVEVVAPLRGQPVAPRLP